MLLKSKITQPAYPSGIVPRPRLFTRMAQWRDVRALVIHAPSGYGKSTLMSHWIDTTGISRQTAWLSLDADDGDPHQFVSHFAAALETIVPGAFATVDAVLTDSQGDPARALNKLLIALEYELAPAEDVDDPHILVVLDDLQRVPTSTIDPLILRILEQGPRRLHLALLSRHATTLPLARLYVRQALLVLEIDDLRFTAAEVCDYLQAQGYVAPDEKSVVELTRRSEGWITALQLGVLSSPTRNDVAGLTAALQRGDEWLTRYAVDEVLNQQSAEVRSFLLQTSILDAFNPALCTAVTGQENAADILTAGFRANLFLIPLGRRAGWFRYHHLFQDLLQHHLATQADQAAIAALHQRAAAWLADAGEAETATQHLLAAGDVDGAAAFVEAKALAIMPRDPFSAQRLLDLMTDTPAAQRLGLLLARCFLSFLFDAAGLAHLVQQVGEIFQARPDLRTSAPTLWAEYLFHRAEVEYMSANIDKALEMTEEAQAHAHLLNDFVLGSLHFLQMALFNLKGLETNANHCGEKASSAYTRAGFAAGLVALQRERAKMALQRGEAPAASQQFRALIEEQTHTGPMVTRELTLACLAAAENSYWQLDVTAAVGYQERMLALAAQLDDKHLMHLARFLRYLYTEAERSTEIEWPGPYAQVVDIPVNHPLQFKAVELIMRALITCDQEECTRHFVQTTGLLGMTIQPTHREQVLVPYCLAYLVRGDDLPGLTPLLHDALAVRMKSGNRFGSIHILALTAWQQLLLNDRTAALASLEQAIRLEAETGYIGILPRIPALVPLLQEVEEETMIDLTDQEQRVLVLLAADCTYPETAEALQVTVNTVRTHVRNLYRKLGVNRRTHAVAAARERGLLPTTHVNREQADAAPRAASGVGAQPAAE